MAALTGEKKTVRGGLLSVMDKPALAALRRTFEAEREEIAFQALIVRGRDLVEETRAIVDASKKLRERLYHPQKAHAERSAHKRGSEGRGDEEETGSLTEKALTSTR
jgi:hypothetical protein